MNVLVIPEDFRKDEPVLKPIISAMMAWLGKQTAKVRVCRDPHLGGISQALNAERIKEVLERYKGMVQLFLLCVDRDGQSGRRQQLDKLESDAAALLGAERVFFAENAWQEIEVWILAGHGLPAEWRWSDVREDTDPKEHYYLPFARQRGVEMEPAEGRGTLACEAAAQYNRIRQLCPDDIAALETKIGNWIGGPA